MTRTGHKLKFKSLTGSDFELVVPSARKLSNAPFFLSVHKAGSSLQTDVVETICNWFDISFLNIPAQLFNYGLDPDNCPDEVVTLLTDGHVCTGFREAWILESLPRYHSSPKMLLLRDPRDIAVSLYFSVINHPMPPGGPVQDDITGAKNATAKLSISEFVLAGFADDIFRNMQIFLRHAKTIQNFTVVRYEDVIFTKRIWFAAMAEQLHVNLSTELLEQLVERFDVFPEKENPMAHIRKVVPGDYAGRLNTTALGYIESKYSDVFDSLKYPLFTG